MVRRMMTRDGSEGTAPDRDSKERGKKRGRGAMEGLVGGDVITAGKKRRPSSKGPVSRKQKARAESKAKAKAVMDRMGKKKKQFSGTKFDASLLGGEKGKTLEFAENMKEKYPVIDNRTEAQKKRDKRMRRNLSQK